MEHHVNYFTLETLHALMEPHGFTHLGHEGKYHFSYPQDHLLKDGVKYLLARLGFTDVLCTYWRLEGAGK